MQVRGWQLMLRYIVLNYPGETEIYNQNFTLSHLSAHVVNRLLHENRKFIPKYFNC